MTRPGGAAAGRILERLWQGVAGELATTSPRRSSCLSATSSSRFGRMSKGRDGRTPPLPMTAVRCEEVRVLMGEQGRRPSCWGDDSPGPGAEDADPAEARIAWMVVGVRPPAKRTAPWRADRFGAAAHADPGHGNGA